MTALLRVAGVTAGLAESNGSLPPGFLTHVTCRLTAKKRDQLRNPTLGNRVSATLLLLSCPYVDLPQNEATQIVLRGVEESMLCRVMKRLVGDKLSTDDAYKQLVANKTCFDAHRRLRRAAACAAGN